MSAPNNKYSTEYLMGEIGGKSRKLIRQALALAEYGSDAAFKQLFHLDAVTHRTDSQGNAVVIGMVGESGSNKEYHAATRYSKLRMVKAGTAYILLNDAGLNTMPHVEILEATVRYVCNQGIRFSLVSAKYAGTTQVIATWKNLSQLEVEDITVIVSNGLEAAASATMSWQNAEGSTVKWQRGDKIQVSISATNAEGTWLNPTVLQYRAIFPAARLQGVNWRTDGSSIIAEVMAMYFNRIVYLVTGSEIDSDITDLQKLNGTDGYRAVEVGYTRDSYTDTQSWAGFVYGREYHCYVQLISADGNSEIHHELFKREQPIIVQELRISIYNKSSAVFMINDERYEPDDKSSAVDLTVTNDGLSTEVITFVPRKSGKYKITDTYNLLTTKMTDSLTLSLLPYKDKGYASTSIVIEDATDEDE